MVLFFANAVSAARPFRVTHCSLGLYFSFGGLLSYLEGPRDQFAPLGEALSRPERPVFLLIKPAGQGGMANVKPAGVRAKARHAVV